VYTRSATEATTAFRNKAVSIQILISISFGECSFEFTHEIKDLRGASFQLLLPRVKMLQKAKTK
jgi:hypothetical protein